MSEKLCRWASPTCRLEIQCEVEQGGWLSFEQFFRIYIFKLIALRVFSWSLNEMKPVYGEPTHS